MFGLSMGELAIILLVAVVVVGPKELPTVVRAVVRTLAQIRGIGQEFRKNFDELAKEAELNALRDEFIQLPTIIDLEGKEQPVYDISDDLKADAEKRLPKPAEKTPTEEMGAKDER